ncbi:LLM class flavin-dependent oxidoreductase [Pseudonocardia acidicola]|uniref:LLM class flavin-dependent oxidoreductase n=1 Tax=Pseudonocardia acidicola TaxID=2724939 RepID=A0ABX1S8P5_9PSEU|nr:LLM class flavin-dependent oxidoreductase [Pseudonocardia acidicola]NMH96634.1 LLM class flavin-dependent oxidoreductase [Pseudonocardia acidicola]
MPRLAASLIFSHTSLAAQVDLVRTLEAAGFDRVFFGEAWREPVVPMAAALGNTSSVGIGSAISQIFPVNPVVTAQQVAQLDELGPGRVSVGLGVGASFVVERWFGIPFERPLQRAREFTEVLRGVLASPEEGPFSYDGQLFSVRKYRLPFTDKAPHVPIHLAAVGPRMQALAGEVADGVVIGALHSDRTMEQTLKWLRAGAGKRGRRVDDLHIWYYLACCVSADPDRARALARRSLVYLAQYPHYHAVYAAEGFGEISARIAELVRAKDMEKAEQTVTDEMVERFAVAGTVDECRAQLRRYSDYPGTPVLHLIPFRISEDEVRESFHLAAELAR